ncbi:TVP38/TMEM64 family protein [Bacillus oleivorans]|nr:VTT domain-containing protein [Bacillus oleivorans]
MENAMSLLFTIIETGGMLAPIAFVLFHVLRQFFFIPVPVVCMAGGILFGTTFGTLFSIVGLMISCLLFYMVIEKLPKTYEKLMNIKKKWFGPHSRLTMGQITILRLIPFVHYQLLNVMMIERARSFGKYVIGAFWTNLPLAFFYTVFGEFISGFTPTIVIIILAALSVLFYILREKVVVLKWKEFFPKASEGQ